MTFFIFRLYNYVYVYVLTRLTSQLALSPIFTLLAHANKSLFVDVIRMHGIDRTVVT